MEPIIVQGFPDIQPNKSLVLVLSIVVSVLYFLIGIFIPAIDPIVSGISDNDMTLFFPLHAVMSLINIIMSYYIFTTIELDFIDLSFKPRSLMEVFFSFQMIGMLFFMYAMMQLFVMLGVLMVLMMGGLVLGILLIIPVGAAYLTVQFLGSSYGSGDTLFAILSAIYSILFLSYISRKPLTTYLKERRDLTRIKFNTIYTYIRDYEIRDNFLIAAVGKEIKVYQIIQNGDAVSYSLYARLIGHRSEIIKLTISKDTIYSISREKNRVGMWEYGNTWSFKESLTDSISGYDDNESHQPKYEQSAYMAAFEKGVSLGLSREEADTFARNELDSDMNLRNRFLSSKAVYKPENIKVNRNWIVLGKKYELLVIDKKYNVIKEIKLGNQRKIIEYILLGDQIFAVVDEYDTEKDILFRWDIQSEISEPEYSLEFHDKSDALIFRDKFLIIQYQKIMRVYNLEHLNESPEEIITDKKSVNIEFSSNNLYSIFVEKESTNVNIKPTYGLERYNVTGEHHKMISFEFSGLDSFKVSDPNLFVLSGDGILKQFSLYKSY